MKFVKDSALSFVPLCNCNFLPARPLTKNGLESIQHRTMRGTPFVYDAEVLVGCGTRADGLARAIDT